MPPPPLSPYPPCTLFFQQLKRCCCAVQLGTWQQCTVHVHIQPIWFTPPHHWFYRHGSWYCKNQRRSLEDMSTLERGIYVVSLIHLKNEGRTAGMSFMCHRSLCIRCRVDDTPPHLLSVWLQVVGRKGCTTNSRHVIVLCFGACQAG